MRGHVICPCCGRPIPVNPADIGKAVVCPISRELVPVTAAGVQFTPDAPRGRSGSRTVLCAGVLLLLSLMTVGGLWVLALTRSTEEAGVTGGRRAAPEPVAAVVPLTAGNLTPASEPVTAVSDPGSAVAPTEPVLIPPPPSAPPSGTVVPTSRTPAPPPPESSPVPAPPRQPTSKGQPVPRAGGTDHRGFEKYTLAKRIDPRSADELRRELLAVREISLDTPASPRTSSNLIAVARSGRLPVYPGPAVAAKGRPDLASLPFRGGADAALFRESAENLDVLSKQLRSAVQSCIPPGGTDSRPDPDKLYERLLAPGSEFRGGRWATAEAVPCVQQMLQPEDRDIRRMSVELLRGIDTPAAAIALTGWAVFDVEADNRAAAVNALRGRDRSAVAARLCELARYPWPRAAEHAAEALVALDCREAAPRLAALLALPDPDAPVPPELPGRPGRYRREMVRVNHARNCLLCHRPSFQATDLVRAAIPDPTRPLAPPTTPAGYSSGQTFVAADTTYLRQEFSVVQPVPNPGPWPPQQRYDYLVAVRPEKPGEADAGADSPYRRALRFALAELTGSDRGADPGAWADVRGAATAADSLTAAAALEALGRIDLSPYWVLKFNEFDRPLLGLTDDERTVLLSRLRRLYGGSALQLALIAYLDPLTRTGDESARAAAGRLLAVARAATGREPAGLTTAELDAVRGLLGDSNPKARAAALRALLADQASAKAMWELLVRLLKADPDAAVRRLAAEVLGTIPFLPDRGYEALVAAAGQSDAGVRLAAARTLSALKHLPRSVGRPLADALVAGREWDSDNDRKEFNTTVADLLADLGRRADGAVSPLAKAAASGSSVVPDPVLARALRAVGPPARADLPDLVLALGRPGVKMAAAEQLAAAGDDALEPLLTGLKSETAAVRAGAVEVLGTTAALNRGGASRGAWRQALDALAEVKTSDRSEEVRAVAAAALDKLTRAVR